MKLLVLASLALAASAAAQAPNAARAKAVSITMTDRGYVPRRIVLQRGAPYVLHVVNRSDKGHNLTQKSFFHSARVEPHDRGWTRGGRISLEAHRSATIRLRAPMTRPGGTYEFSSTTLGDADNEYTGVFIMR